MSNNPQPSVFNPANALTVLRLVLVPVFAWMLLSHPDDLWWRLASTAVFGLAILTDALDGRIARKYNLITDFGKIWDSIADKALTGMAFVGLSILGELPWWITVLVLVREWGITWMRVVMLKYGVMAANRGGKLKTVLQSIALLLFLPGLPLMPMWLQVIAWLVMGAAVLLTLVTALDYIREAIALRRSALAERQLTLATSESLTGGLLGATITAVPGASRYYLGGVVVYATEQKARIGGVNPAVLTSHGVISEQTVVEMVIGVQQLTGAGYALAASGVAGPDPQEGHPPGVVWIAAIGPRIGSIVPPPTALRFEFDGDRLAIRQQTVSAALQMLLHLLDPAEWEQKS